MSGLVGDFRKVVSLNLHGRDTAHVGEGLKQKMFSQVEKEKCLGGRAHTKKIKKDP